MKKLRYLFIGVMGLFFFSILLASSVRNIYGSADGGTSRLGFLSKPIKFMAEMPSMVKSILSMPEFYVSNTESEDGFTRTLQAVNERYPKLLTSYKDEPFGQKFELLNIQDGSLIKRWSPDNKLLYSKAYNENNPRRPDEGSDLYFMHAHMSNDSSLYFTAQLTSILAKIDAKSNLVWMKNDKTYHHTIEPDNNGKLYVCSRPFEAGNYDFLPGEFDFYKRTILDDHVTIINEKTGDELFSKSVIQILVENGYQELILNKGQVISDMIHLNDIQPALTDSKYWSRGDLLISCRNLSAVFLYRPETNKILWLKQGPWSNQHDVDFYDSDKILVFGNDVIREESVIDARITTADLSFSKGRPHNNAYVYHFKNDSISTPYTELFKTEKIRTITSGRCDILANGDIFIEETNQGRIIIGDSISKKIEYVKRLDEGHVSTLFWSRLIN